MHGYAIEGLVESGYEGDDFDAGRLPEDVQSPGAVFATAPG